MVSAAVYAASTTTLAARGENAVLAWLQKTGASAKFELVTSVDLAGFGWQPPHVASADGADAAHPAVAIDPSANAVAVWDRAGSVQAATFSAPMANAVSIPSAGVVGRPVTFSVSPFDVWSPVSATWNFGDGATATGNIVTHTYSTPGPRQVSVTVANLGLASVTDSGTVSVVVPSLTMTAVSESNRSWARAAKLATVSATHKPPIGTTFRMTLSAAATVKFAFSRAVTGRSVHGHCTRASSANRREHRCTLYRPAGTLTVDGHEGANSVAFYGQLSRTSRLAIGRYKVALTATATSGGATAPQATLKFTIVK
jgi:hypothetical protein